MVKKAGEANAVGKATTGQLLGVAMAKEKKAGKLVVGMRVGVVMEERPVGAGMQVGKMVGRAISVAGRGAPG